MSEKDELALERQICFSLYAASNLFNRLYVPVLGELGLTYPQYLAMLVLWQHEPQTVGELGARLYLDSSTLTPLLKRMEAAGLVTRARDPEDERRVVVRLTEQGRDLRARAVHIPKVLAADCPPEEIDELRESVRSLIAILTRKREPAAKLAKLESAGK